MRLLGNVVCIIPVKKRKKVHILHGSYRNTGPKLAVTPELATRMRLLPQFPAQALGLFLHPYLLEQ